MRRMPHGRLCIVDGFGWGALVRAYQRGRNTWFEEDLETVSGLAREGRCAGLVLPKAEDPAQVNAIRSALPPDAACFGLVETALGVARVRELAPLFDRLFFGSLDYAADLGCAHTVRHLLMRDRRSCWPHGLPESPVPWMVSRRIRVIPTLSGLMLPMPRSWVSREAADPSGAAFSGQIRFPSERRRDCLGGQWCWRQLAMGALPRLMARC